MLRPVDLRTIDALQRCSENIRKEFKQYTEINFRDREIDDISKLIKNLSKSVDLSYFYIGYRIPQISKEFDLLKFSDDVIVNIELKTSDIGEQRILEQLEKNRYYLSGFHEYETIYQFTYISESNTLFKYEEGKIKKSNFENLSEILKISGNRVSLDEICNPSQYLVSPFNNTNFFLKDKYFLTKAQKDIKKEILENNKDKYSIKGSAGTGKTLLIYDIAKSLMGKNKKIVIYHCGMLNEGQQQLNTLGWNIKPIRDFDIEDNKNYEFIIFDEIQRINDIKYTYTTLVENQATIIFCGDPRQCLHTHEISNGVFSYLEEVIQKSNRKKLSDKIRSNEEVANFIKLFFNRKATIKHEVKNYDNIYLKYFDNKIDAINCGKNMEKEWKVINLTPSRYSFEYIDVFTSVTELNSHKVIGQEYDRVAVFVGENFIYSNGQLEGSGTYYDSKKMLFENMTRTKKELCLIIVDNPEVLKNCLEIVNQV